MRRPTSHNKRDANEPSIIKAFEACMIQWREGGPLDGWVYIGQWIPVEIKNPDASHEKKTRLQNAFIADCHLFGWPYLVVRDSFDVAGSVNALRCQRLPNFNPLR